VLQVFAVCERHRRFHASTTSLLNFWEEHFIMRTLIVFVICLVGLHGPLLAQNVLPPPTEGPAGFDTPTLVKNPGSSSTSNGIIEPPGDQFRLDQQIYETQHDINTGLGPLYNGRSCAECHQNPVSGGASQFTELRVGHLDANGNFVNPVIPIDDGAAQISTPAGRSVVNDRAVVPQAQEHIPVTENIRALRAALNTLGDGFVEAINDSTLLAIAAAQPTISGGRIHGEAIEVPILEAPGQSRIGRFGWKDQHSSLLSFIGDAYLNEMGVTNRLRPKDTTTIGKVTPDPEDIPDSLGLADIDHFAQFIRGTKVPPRDTNLATTASAVAGEHIFNTVGCAACHIPSITTAPPGTIIDGGTFVVPAALGNKIIHPYSDFLLHDIDTGDGIVQAGPQDTANKLRTAALWGLRERPRFMHDLKSLTLHDAIERHRAEAEHASAEFRRLSDAQKQQLISFLESL
jgi:cytochrome c peroxidase